MKIDVDAVLKARLPRYYRFIPRFVVRRLERTVCQDRLNEMLQAAAGCEGADFCRSVLDHLNVEVSMADGHSLPADTAGGRLIYVSNHPLGGLDGMALIDLVTRHHRGVEPWFVVNDLLMAVEPLQRVFLPVNKHGRQNRNEVDALDEALRSDRPVIIFPAGLVSRRNRTGGIADLEWRKKFIDYAVRYRRDIVPLYFDGRNTDRFYRLASLRERSGLKFNIEMILLPSEVFKAEGSKFKVYAGPTIPWADVAAAGLSRKDQAARIKEQVYALKP